MALTTQRLQEAQPIEKPYKLYDTGGLYCIVQPTGAIWWRYRYKVQGKEKGLSLGVYPVVSLDEARNRRNAAREAIAKGTEPVADKPKAVLTKTNTFQIIGEEWLAMKSSEWSQETLDKNKWMLNTFVYPKIVDYVENDVSHKVAFGDIHVEK